MSKQSYAEKLRDPRWQRKRLQILGRADFKCEDCGDGGSTLHVHHCLYIRGQEPWEYRENELRALCESCHDLRASVEHDAVLEFKRLMALMPLESLEDLVSSILLAKESAVDGHSISLASDRELICNITDPAIYSAAVDWAVKSQETITNGTR